MSEQAPDHLTSHASPPQAYPGLRGWLDRVRDMGKLRQINGASWDLEIGALTDMNVKGPKWTLLFDQIPGYPAGYRVLTGALIDTPRVALTLGLSPQTSPMELVQVLHARLGAMATDLSKFPVRTVADAPFLRHSLTGNEVDVLRFPVPKWHEQDGGRFIGTSSALITRDRDTGWVNMGTYRSQVHGADRVGVAFGSNRHGRTHYEKHEERGEDCPVAVSYGHHPIINVVSSLEAPAGVSEYAYAGVLMQQPVPVVPGPLTGLPVPADSEIVVEGYIVAHDRIPEGPHGEFFGYYAGDVMAKCFIRVEAIHHRADPILTGTRSGQPPHDYSFYRCPIRSAMLWHALERAGVPGIKGVWCHEAGLSRAFNVIAISQKYNGHAEQAGLIASQVREGIAGGRFVIVVDEDIDPTDMNAVVWALSTRTDPAGDIEFIRNSMSRLTDPMGEAPVGKKPGGEVLEHRNVFAMRASRAVINACIPYGRRMRGTFPSRVEMVPQALAGREDELRRKLGE